MQSKAESSFRTGRATFEPGNHLLIVGGHRRQLSPKAFAVLNYLFERPGQLVTKGDLLDNVWPDVCVVDGVLKKAVRDVRELLGDDARAPRFIETVHRRGYRFIGEQLLTREGPLGSVQSRPGATRLAQVTRTMVGRETELQFLCDTWRRALEGQPQATVIYGDPGIGKTSLVDEWLHRERPAQCGANVAITRCTRSGLQHPYAGFLDALKALCEAGMQATVLAVAARLAPGWLRLAPWLSNDAERTNPNRSERVSTSGSLLLEAVALLEALATEQPLLLVFDDAHLCDQATRDVLMMVRRRCSTARLMLIITTCSWHPCQSPEVFLVSAHARMAPWRKLNLNPLDEASVEHLVRARRTVGPGSTDLAGPLHKSTGGHPLVLEDIFDKLEGVQLSSGVKLPTPAAFVLRMSHQLGNLALPERRLLQAASIALTGSFSAAMVAAVMEKDVIEVEDELDDLADRAHWLRRAGERRWPDGTLGQLFRFPLPIYRDFAYQTLPCARRRSLHLRHARRLEAAYRGNIEIVAENLAHHYGASGDDSRAGRYRTLARIQCEMSVCSRPAELVPRRHGYGFEDQFAGRSATAFERCR